MVLHAHFQIGTWPRWNKKQLCATYKMSSQGMNNSGQNLQWGNYKKRATLARIGSSVRGALLNHLHGNVRKPANDMPENSFFGLPSVNIRTSQWLCTYTFTGPALWDRVVLCSTTVRCRSVLSLILFLKDENKRSARNTWAPAVGLERSHVRWWWHTDKHTHIMIYQHVYKMYQHVSKYQ